MTDTHRYPVNLTPITCILWLKYTWVNKQIVYKELVIDTRSVIRFTISLSLPITTTPGSSLNVKCDYSRTVSLCPMVFLDLRSNELSWFISRPGRRSRQKRVALKRDRWRPPEQQNEFILWIWKGSDICLESRGRSTDFPFMVVCLTFFCHNTWFPWIFCFQPKI